MKPVSFKGVEAPKAFCEETMKILGEDQEKWVEMWSRTHEINPRLVKYVRKGEIAY